MVRDHGERGHSRVKGRASAPCNSRTEKVRPRLVLLGVRDGLSVSISHWLAPPDTRPLG